MRTTVTLDPDVETLVRQRMQERGVSFKAAVNDALRAGLTVGRRSAEVTRTPTVDLGVPVVSLDRALALAGELEDDEIVRKTAVGR